MPTIEEIQQGVRTWVETVSGRTTILGEPNGPQPSVPYCTIKLLLLTWAPHDLKTDLDGLTEEVRGMFKADFSIQAIGGNDADLTSPVSVVKRLINSLRSDLAMLELEKAGVGLGGSGNPTDISAVVGGRIEPRAAATVSFHAHTSDMFNFESAIEAGIEVTGVNLNINDTVALVVPPDPVGPCES